MGWSQQINYQEVDAAVPRLPVRKQIWNGRDFVPLMIWSFGHRLTEEQKTWLTASFGPPNQYSKGHYWDHARSGDLVVMDEQVYTWFQMKWGRK